MIRKINSPQGLIALSLFLGTFCAFEAISLDDGSQKKDSSSTDKKDPKKNSSIKKLISDSITGDIKSLQEAIANKQEILRKINDAMEKNSDELVTNWTEKLNNFKEETKKDISVLEKYLERKNLEWGGFANFWKLGWGYQARKLDDQPVSNTKISSDSGSNPTIIDTLKPSDPAQSQTNNQATPTPTKTKKGKDSKKRQPTDKY